MRQLLYILFCVGFVLTIKAQETNDVIHKIDSEYFKEQREIKVHLPKKVDTTERLPVIYVFDAQWSPFFKLTTSIIDYLIEIKELPKSIVVGVNSNKRQYELTPEPVNEDWKIPSLGGAKFLENHLTHEVIPMIDRLYHPAPFRTAIGHSLGGTFVLNSIVDNPKLFNAYIAISPNLQIDDEEIVLKIQRNIDKIKKLNKFVFTTIGNKGKPDIDFLPSVKKLDALLQDHNSKTFSWQFSVYDGFTHATIPTESIHRGILEVSKKWEISEEQKEKMLNTGNVLTNFDNFYKNLSNWTGYTNIPSFDDVYDFGYFLEKKEMYAEAVALYKLELKNYPQKSQLYNKIGENLVKTKNDKQAKEYFDLALTILEKEKDTFEYEGTYEYYKNVYDKNSKKIKL
ncbi:putative alpha/beta superfamily hydrolase [Aquimarina sp. EL_43]|uniref:alpha/beta hydrolase-fold protein n=1 Tax=unclassified Aquimarina TaxID=2627091 RepID=UPI0018CA6DF1|nr:MULTISPECIES: alpha/beta hydrolase-fold protein [unclassified Aquimarina]MBG6129017.1 putative alpha/beta superfamily hydrolase [Aquimarina sp. EL_35]MBG6150081.1 putative alpha/beta superfamily hydrolase [Aquimarina sp. EL_32]MBG6167233.1 putative alpha/beta superfamily hydrolase [Aquimarina sp. EL_43]